MQVSLAPLSIGCAASAVRTSLINVVELQGRQIDNATQPATAPPQNRKRPQQTARVTAEYRDFAHAP